MRPDPEFMRECLDGAMEQLHNYLKSKARVKKQKSTTPSKKKPLAA